MAERTWQEVGANRAEVTSTLEAVAANNAQLVTRGNAAFKQRDRALRQTVREEFYGYRLSGPPACQEGVAGGHARSGLLVSRAVRAIHLLANGGIVHLFAVYGYQGLRLTHISLLFLTSSWRLSSVRLRLLIAGDVNADPG